MFLLNIFQETRNIFRPTIWFFYTLLVCLEFILHWFADTKAQMCDVIKNNELMPLITEGEKITAQSTLQKAVG